MNPSSNIKRQIGDLFKTSLNNPALIVNETIEPGGDNETKLKSYNAIQMASVEREKISSEKIISKTKDDFFYYPTDNLNRNYSKITKGSLINICLYSVTLGEYKPFIQYLLYKNKKSNILTFPFFEFSEGNLLDLCNKNIEGILDIDYLIKGYFKDRKNIYVIVSLPTNFCSLQHLTSDKDWWFTLLSEIINEEKVLYFPIHRSVSNLFYKNSDLLYLLDENNRPFEAPISLYNGQHADKTNFIAKFGISKFSPLASMGPYYYFSTYDLASKFGSYSYNFKPLKFDDKVITDNEFGRYIKGGIVRFAIFTGRLKVFLNRDWDKRDESLISENREEKERKIIEMDGSWTKNYDSTCVAEIVFSDNSINQNGTKYCVKNYYQQVPLSYHFLDKSSVPEMFKPDKLIKII